MQRLILLKLSVPTLFLSLTGYRLPAQDFEDMLPTETFVRRFSTGNRIIAYILPRSSFPFWQSISQKKKKIIDLVIRTYATIDFQSWHVVGIIKSVFHRILDFKIGLGFYPGLFFKELCHVPGSN
jgi:hypothetical protein